MNFSPAGLAPAILAGLIVFGPILHGQENGTSRSQGPAVSLQKQIDELKEGQVRLLSELAEIKQLLLEKPARVDYPARSAAPGAISINVQGEPFRGDRRARVAIMEYSDFDCSFCAKYAQEVYPQIEKEYIQPGRIKYFFRDLPGPGETNALLKARAARCAGDQGKFWEMHDRLFATQTDPAGQDLAAQARWLGLDAEKFSACLTTDRYLENIRLSIAGAKRIGIHGTPAFLIGPVSEDGGFMNTTNVLVGGESIAPLKAALDALLASPASAPPGR